MRDVIANIMFQSTFPRRERPDDIEVLLNQNGFNPRSREGNDAGNMPRITLRRCFNPRSREGNDTRGIKVTREIQAFQSTFPRRERRRSRRQQKRRNKFQSTFPRRERLNKAVLVLDFEGFNPRSREGNDYRSALEQAESYGVSIHVPAKGTTLVWIRFRDGQRVSIHVPAKGTTQKEHEEFSRRMVSIHVPAKGTTNGSKGLKNGRRFQSTFPRRERPSA